MLLVADIHGAFDDLQKVASRGDTLLILGDLLNFVDYRTNEGIVADVFGPEFVAEIALARRDGEYGASRRLWTERSAGREAEVRAQVEWLVRDQYRRCAQALEGTNALVTYGNVDWPDLLSEALPKSCTFVDGEVVEIEGWRVGIVGGGAKTPIRARGEVGEDRLAERLEALGPVDILCTHVAPAVKALRRDVVTGKDELASGAIVEYILRHKPAFHYFGDVHQPQAHRWRIGSTASTNVGYFRATGRPVSHPAR